MASSPRGRRPCRKLSASNTVSLASSLFSSHFSLWATSSYVLPQAPGANPCVRLPPQTVTAPLYLPSNPSIPSKSQFTPFTAVPLPTPSNAAALEPPPVPNTTKTQILAGTDIDLSSLLSLLPPAETHRQIDCGDFSVTLKNPTPNSSRPLSFSEFTIAFGRYTETVCSVFPHRRRELNDSMSDSCGTRAISWRSPFLHVP